MLNGLTKQVLGTALEAEMTEWQNRPLDRVYPVVFVDALVVKFRGGQVRNKPFYLAVGDTAEAGAERVRDRFRRPNQLTMRSARSTVNRTHPRRAVKSHAK